MCGCDSNHVDLGTKSGGRRIFDAEWIPQPAGFGDLATAEECVDAMVELRRTRPGLDLILEFLIHGRYDWESARFAAPSAGLGDD